MKKDVNNRQRFWLADPRHLTPDAVLQCAEDLTEGSGIATSNVAVTLSGSPLAVQLTGTVTQLRPEFDSLEDQRFVNGNVKGKLAAGGNLNINVNFGAGHVNVQVQNSNLGPAEDVFTLLEEKFPRWFGLSDDEIRDRLTELEQLTREARKAEEASDEARQLRDTIVNINENVSTIKQKTLSAHAEVENAKEKTMVTLQEVIKSNQDVTNSKSQVQSDREAVKNMRDEIGGAEEKIKRFFSEIDENKKKLEAAVTDAEDTVEANTERTNELISENEALRNEVREHLLKAVGASLFSSFEERKKRIEKSKWVWAGLTLFAILAQVGMFAWLAQTATGTGGSATDFLTPRFILRATASIPIVFFIGYAIHQYAKERDYEEMYGFKSTLSFSLSPYIDLVRDLQSRGVDERHIEFVISTIEQVFKDPLVGPAAYGQKGGADSTVIKDLLDRVIKIIERGGGAGKT